VNLAFLGEGKDEIAVIDSIDVQIFEEKLGIKPSHLKHGDKIIQIDPFYFRPTEVDILIGDASKAKTQLGWEPRYDLDSLICEMIKSDIQVMKKEAYLRAGGFSVSLQMEDIL
jgi:GDPmannose 4,6-dehydratase